MYVRPLPIQDTPEQDGMRDRHGREDKAFKTGQLLQAPNGRVGASVPFRIARFNAVASSTMSRTFFKFSLESTNCDLGTVMTTHKC